MSPHHSDQMSQRSQVSRVALCMSKVKVPLVSESVTRSPIELFWTAKQKAQIHIYVSVIRMKGRVRRGHIAQNSLRSSSLNQSLALQEEEEEFRQPVVLAVTSLQTVCPVQPAAQLVVALPSPAPSPAPSPVPSHPPSQPPSPPHPHLSQARLSRVTVSDLPPSYSMADLQSLPKYSEVTSV